MSKPLTKSELQDLARSQDDVANRLVEHVKSVLIEGFNTDMVMFILEFDENIPASRLFSDRETDLIRTAARAIHLTAEIDEMAFAAHNAPSFNLGDLLNEKLSQLVEKQPEPSGCDCDDCFRYNNSDE